ncbi:Cloroperoxidase [Calocera viscosa TUFC12733]|uniref:Cloroperoxidase n=1 Tax=Calocera viscosa (strain TUFC12733) TaxID=1330018 RepID=A0A167I9B4_CALVF|nr:Cloroperoxidase [Calocera viscosa TUFC12733]
MRTSGYSGLHRFKIVRFSGYEFSLSSVNLAVPADEEELANCCKSYDQRKRRVYKAAPYSPNFAYTGAQLDGLPGTGIGGIPVPAPGDTAHEYQHPPPGAFRGPCPGLNALANHGFISRDGVTNFDELVAGQQNMYNVGWDLAVVLAVLGIAFDGDIITEKLSIGGDATNRTAFIGGLFGKEGGLNSHNKFEVDASLSRNDYYLADGDNYTFNTTLFAMMTETVGTTSSPQDPRFDLKGLGLYKGLRYQQSLNTNPKFYFGPKQLIFYGAVSFLYELFPSSTQGNTPNLGNVASFFGAVPSSTNPGTFTSQPERAPPEWHNRVKPYSLVDAIVQLNLLYLESPVLFGGNTGVGNFDALGTITSLITGGTYTPPPTPQELLCLVYQLVTDDDPDSLDHLLDLPLDVLNFAINKLDPVFGQLGCSFSRKA